MEKKDIDKNSAEYFMSHMTQEELEERISGLEILTYNPNMIKKKMDESE